MSDVLVSENVVGPAMDRLRAEFDVRFEPDLWQHPDRLAEAIGSARALVVRNRTQVTRELLQRAGNLEIVARAGVGLDNVDTDAASELGIVVSFTPSENSISVAELVLGLMLSLVRVLTLAVDDTRRGGWDRVRFTGGELYGRTLGLIGFGRIGRLVAGRARAFGMSILATDEFLRGDDPALAACGATLVTLDQLLAQSDIVSVHVPLTASTRGLLDQSRLSAMKRGAFLINTSRGEVVDEAALISVLKNGTLAGAGLDVRESEPPVIGGLEQLPNVLLTPHIGAFTYEAQGRVVDAVCRDVSLVLSGQPAEGAFNFGRPTR